MQSIVHSTKTGEADGANQSARSEKAEWTSIRISDLRCASREALAQKVIVEKVPFNAAAAAFNVSAKTARKWVHRYQAQHRAGLYDLSSRPHHSPRRTPAESVEFVLQLRRQRWTGMRIAQSTGLSRATVSRILPRHQAQQDQRSRTRRAHPSATNFLIPATCCTSTSRNWLVSTSPDIASPAIPGMKPAAPDGSFFMSPSTTTPASPSASCCPMKELLRPVSFLRPAVAYFARFGIQVRRVMTDNGSLLLLRPLCTGRWQRSATPAHPHSHLHSAHQWQGRTLHPNCHSRVGLCPSLPELRRTASPSGSLDPPVQLASTTHCSQPKTTHQPIRTPCQQPLDTPHLRVS